MKYLKFIPLVLLALTLFGCPDKDEEMDSEITIVNNSNRSLISSEDFGHYPDTSITMVSNPFDQIIRERFTIKPNSIYKQRTDWRRFFKDSDSSKIRIFLFDIAVLDTVAWDKIREDYLVAKRYEYTLEQLDSLNWTITYP